MSRLKGKVAVITGGAMGMGAEMARRCAEEGADVVVADVQDELAQEVAKDCGDRAILFHLDVATPTTGKR